jgi:hypothetical protein
LRTEEVAKEQKNQFPGKYNDVDLIKYKEAKVPAPKVNSYLQRFPVGKAGDGSPSSGTYKTHEALDFTKKRVEPAKFSKEKRKNFADLKAKQSISPGPMSNISPSIKAFDKIVSLSPGAGRKRL